MENNDRLIFLLGQARHRIMTSLDKSLLKTAGITSAQSGVLFYLMKKILSFWETDTMNPIVFIILLWNRSCFTLFIIKILEKPPIFLMKWRMILAKIPVF